MARLKGVLERALDRVLACVPHQADASRLRAAMEIDRDKLTVFMTRRDVEPTNNGSERELRTSVVFRKVTNGFRSQWGAKVYADLISVVATGRKAGMSALAAIRAALAPPRPA